MKFEVQDNDNRKEGSVVLFIKNDDGVVGRRMPMTWDEAEALHDELARYLRNG